MKNTELDPVFGKDTKVDEVKTEGAWEVVTVKLDSGPFEWVRTKEAANAFKPKDSKRSLMPKGAGPHLFYLG